MTNINSVQGANRFQLEPLESITPRNNQPAPVNYEQSNSGGLQSLDSLNANNYSDPNNNIPRSDILAPIDALNPEIPGQDRLDTKEKGLTGFIGGVFKGFGKAGLDTVKGVATLGKVVVSAVRHPRAALNYVGGGISYAVNNPLKTAKTIAVDLPVGIVKGIISPYAEAITTGKYGEATGRAVFDVGMILLTAGVGDKAGGAGQGAGAIEKTTKGAAGIEKATKGSKLIETVVDNADLLDDVASAGTKVTGSTVKLGKDAIKIGNVTGNVVINIGNTTATVASGASKATKTAQTLAGIERATKVARGTTGAVAAVETVANAGKISLGLADLGSTLSRGASRLGGLFKPVGIGMSNGLTAIVGEKTATLIGRGLGTVGHGISVGGQFVKTGAIFVKVHPVASALIAGKTVDIIDKGLKASDNYDPGYIK